MRSPTSAPTVTSTALSVAACCITQRRRMAQTPKICFYQNEIFPHRAIAAQCKTLVALCSKNSCHLYFCRIRHTLHILWLDEEMREKNDLSIIITIMMAIIMIIISMLTISMMIMIISLRNDPRRESPENVCCSEEECLSPPPALHPTI